MPPATQSPAREEQALEPVADQQRSGNTAQRRRVARPAHPRPAPLKCRAQPLRAERVEPAVLQARSRRSKKGAPSLVVEGCRHPQRRRPARHRSLAVIAMPCSLRGSPRRGPPNPRLLELRFLIGRFGHCAEPVPFRHPFHLKPLPSAGIAQLQRRSTGFSATLAGPTLPSRVARLARATPPAGLPVLRPFPSSTRAAAITPAEPVGARVARFPTAGFPVIRAGRLPRYPFRGLLGVYSRCGGGREPGYPGPPAQIRTCALAHTAPTLGG